MQFIAGEYDIAVIGAGHAGCEAALAAAKMGFKTVIFAVTLDGIANMACNPSIGGTAKGQLVREIDALGGAMAKIADKTAVQVKILNVAKGPAVYSPRAQIDRRRYQIHMKNTLESCPNLDVKQAEITKIITQTDENGKKYVTGVVTHLDAVYKCKCAIACTGTYLKGKVIIGDYSYSSGPDGHFPANELSESLSEAGFNIIRLKTGTPARVNSNSVDFTRMEIQKGDEKDYKFSHDPEYCPGEVSQEKERVELPCYLTHTTEETKRIITENLHRSPLYSGKITGVGPRYCPSLEDKIVRFSDKERHQVFIEPMGYDTCEMYLQGMSSSLPEEVQNRFISSVPGLENVKIMRPAYAIEYDAIDARQLKLSLEASMVDGLFCAGQINGSSGYEEAAAQGLMAGINAALKLQGRPSFVLDRSEAYIGVLIDDLVTRGTKEPYRMMTSRAEYRLLLRQDNADQRLFGKAYEIGMISKEKYDGLVLKMAHVAKEIERMDNEFIPPSKEVNEYLDKCGSSLLKGGCRMSDLLRRPELLYDDVVKIGELAGKKADIILTGYEKQQVEISVKYDGYIKRQMQSVEHFKKLENKKLPMDLDYSTVTNISLEAREKLNKTKPESLGQASRITGVSPADIASLMVFLNKGNDNNE